MEARKNSSSSGSRQQRLISVTCFAPFSPHTHSYIHTFPSRSALCCVKEQSGRSFVSHLHLFCTISSVFVIQPLPGAETALSFPWCVLLIKLKESFYVLFFLCNDFMYLYANPNWTAMSATWCARLLPSAVWGWKQKGNRAFLKKWRPDYGTSRLLTGEPQPLLNYLVALQLKDRHFDCHCIFAAFSWWFTAAVRDSFWAFVLLFGVLTCEPLCDQMCDW